MVKGPRRLYQYVCPYNVLGCNARFQSQGGRTNHVRSSHTNHNIIQDPENVSHVFESEDDTIHSSGTEHEDAQAIIIGDEFFHKNFEHKGCLARVSDAADVTKEEQGPLSKSNTGRQRNYHPYLTGKLLANIMPGYLLIWLCSYTRNSL